MISPQAKTVLAVQVLQIVAVIVAVLVSKVSASAKAISVLSTVFFMGIGAYITFYAINCIVYGNCDLFAWLLVGIVIVFFAFAVIGSVLGVAAARQYQTQLNAAWASSMSSFAPQQIGSSPSAVLMPATPVVAPVSPSAQPPQQSPVVVSA